MLYDFDGDTQNGELVVREGDHLTVTDKVRPRSFLLFFLDSGADL